MILIYCIKDTLLHSVSHLSCQGHDLFLWLKITFLSSSIMFTLAYPYFYFSYSLLKHNLTFEISTACFAKPIFLAFFCSIYGRFIFLESCCLNLPAHWGEKKTTHKKVPLTPNVIMSKVKHGIQLYTNSAWMYNWLPYFHVIEYMSLALRFSWKIFSLEGNNFYIFIFKY